MPTLKETAMRKVTREAVEALANEQGKSVLAMLTELQGAAAKLHDDETLETLCEIKAQVLGL